MYNMKRYLCKEFDIYEKTFCHAKDLYFLSTNFPPSQPVFIYIYIQHISSFIYLSIFYLSIYLLSIYLSIFYLTIHLSLLQVTGIFLTEFMIIRAGFIIETTNLLVWGKGKVIVYISP